jgi:AcrR family transcriptional regulator
VSRCEEIKRNAVTLIARDGFGSMSLRQLARESGIQVGSVYHHYNSKDEILFEVVQDYLDNLLTFWRERAPRGRHKPLTRLRAFVESYVEHFLGYYDQGLVSTFELRMLKGLMQEEVRKSKLAYEAELQGIVQAGMCSGDFRGTDAGHVTIALLAMLTGLCIQQREVGIQGMDDLCISCWQLVEQFVGLPTDGVTRRFGQLKR